VLTKIQLIQSLQDKAENLTRLLPLMVGTNGRVFGDGGSNGAIPGLIKYKMAAGSHLGKLRRNISLEWIIQATLMK